MTPADYAAFTELNVELPVGDPLFLEHARTCLLPTQECATCRDGSIDFARRFFEEQVRSADQTLPVRAKLFLWYLNVRYRILHWLWRWWLIEEEPKWPR
jgi:hypothetical protein